MWLIKVKFKQRPAVWYLSKTEADHPGKFFSEGKQSAIPLDDEQKDAMMQRLSSAFGSELEIWTERI